MEKSSETETSLGQTDEHWPQLTQSVLMCAIRVRWKKSVSVGMRKLPRFWAHPKYCRLSWAKVSVPKTHSRQ